MKRSKIKMLVLAVLTLVCALSFASCNTQKPVAKPAKLKIKPVTQGAVDKLASFTEFIEFDDEGYQKVLISTDSPVRDVKFVDVQEGGLNAFKAPDNVLYSFAELTPEKPFVVTWMNWGTMPHRGLSFVDESGETRFFYLHESGKDGSLLINEFDEGSSW